MVELVGNPFFHAAHDEKQARLPPPPFGQLDVRTETDIAFVVFQGLVPGSISWGFGLFCGLALKD